MAGSAETGRGSALDKVLNKTAGQRFHNHSPLTFERLDRYRRARGRAADVRGPLCVVEDHWVEGGLGDAVLAALAEASVASEIVRFVHLAVRDMPGSGKSAEMLDVAGISAKHIAHAVRELAAFATRRAR